MCPLPKHTPEDGYRIILYRLKEYDASKLQINDLVKCFCAFNMVKLSEDGLVPGYVVLLDMKGVTFSHFMKVTPYVQSIRNILSYLQVRFYFNDIERKMKWKNRHVIVNFTGLSSSPIETSAHHQYRIVY